jgi:hypothetical protein
LLTALYIGGIPKANIKQKKIESITERKEEGMVTTTSIDQLIAKLRALQLETSRTIELLELARGEESQRALALTVDRTTTEAEDPQHQRTDHPLELQHQ